MGLATFNLHRILYGIFRSFVVNPRQFHYRYIIFNCRRCVSADLHCWFCNDGCLLKLLLQFTHIFLIVSGEHPWGDSYCSILYVRNITWTLFLYRFSWFIFTYSNTILKFSTDKFFIPILIAKIILIAPSITDVSALCNAIINERSQTAHQNNSFQTIIDFIKFFLIHRNS